MKGMQLPINLVVITAVVVMVLVTILFFFTSSSGKGVSDVEARKIFFEACSQLECNTPKDVCLEIYRQFPDHESSFYDRFYSSCQTLYGGGASNAVLCFASCGGCAKLTDNQKNYILNGRSSEGLAIELDKILNRCNSVP